MHQGWEKEIFGLSEKLAVPGRGLFDVIFSLVLAIAVVVVISQIYKHTSRGMNFELNFMASLVLLAPVVTMVMLFIRGDLVLSLGLIGSLSIIRFRTPIKDVRDMVFLFWTIAVGLGAGTYNWTIVIVSSLIIALVTYVLYFIKYGRSTNSDFVLVVSGARLASGSEVEKVIKKYAEEARVRSHEAEGDHWEIIFEVRFPSEEDHVSRNMVEEIEKIHGVGKVSLLAPQLALPI